MITLFRKIRQKLIGDGTVRRYFLYAIGEILLVVIGILIAIQINTALDNRVKSEKHQRLVHELYSEFENNLDQLETVLQYHQRVHDSSMGLLELISTDITEVPLEKIRKLFFENGYIWTFDPSNGVLASSISSGDIHLIKNDSLKVMLFSWEDQVLDAREEQDRANTDYDRIRSYVNNHVMVADVLQHEPSIFEVPESHFESNYQAILNDRVYENHLGRRIINTVDVLTELEPLREMNMQILELLMTELDDI